ncbi:unnamed protein product [Meloidogyne enterolobii]|uniref:Uncharacterized protein n=1 Tax=Meloidogyne enterolobii TaxID=390850 RepID=A0ACB0ZPG2_MELEN
MPKADDSVAASGRTLRSSTTSATSTPAVGNEAALMPALSIPALSTSSFVLPTDSDTNTSLPQSRSKNLWRILYTNYWFKL